MDEWQEQIPLFLNIFYLIGPPCRKHPLHKIIQVTSFWATAVATCNHNINYNYDVDLNLDVFHSYRRKYEGIYMYHLISRKIYLHYTHTIDMCTSYNSQYKKRFFSPTSKYALVFVVVCLASPSVCSRICHGASCHSPGGFFTLPIIINQNSSFSLDSIVTYLFLI
jgi:hypothetical protein